MTDEEILRLSLKVKPKEARELLKTHGSAHNVLRNLDYDAIEFKSTRLKATGGNRIIVFDKHNVVAIDGKSGPGKPTPPEPPKPPPLPPKTPPTGPIQNGTFVPKGYRIISDGEEGDATLRAEYKPWLDSLSKEEKHALGVYYGAGAGRINTTLRLGAELENYDRLTTKFIDQALDKSEVPENLVVFRGMYHPGLSKAIDRGKAMDMIVTEKGYTSTTTSKKIAREKFTIPDDDSIIAEIRLPKGTKGGLISPDYSEENEILLPKGTQFRVVGHHTENGKKVVTLEIVPEKKPEVKVSTPKESEAERKARLNTPKSQLTPKYRTEKYKYYVDDDEFAAAKTTKEVEAILKKRYPTIGFDFEGMHHEVAQTTADEFHRLAQKYPKVASKLTIVGIGGMGQDTWIASASSNGKNITFNKEFYGNPDKFNRSRKSSAMSGWTVQHGGEVYTTMTHEFGHQVENYYFNERDKMVVLGVFDEPPPQGGNFAGTSVNMINLFNKWYKPESNLSAYAITTNDTEKKAEGWAEAFSKGEIFEDAALDPYTKAHRKFITNLPPDNTDWKTFKQSDRMKVQSEKKQKEIRGKLQDLYKSVGLLYTG